MRAIRPLVKAGFAHLVLAVMLAASVQAQTTADARPIIKLYIQADGVLPGFRMADAPRYLADQMADAGVVGWAFVPEHAPPQGDRIDWRFDLNPYASGGVRQFFPIPGEQKLFGARHLITAEVRLYIGGEYQTLVFGQTTIQGGGAQDKALAAFVVQMTQNMLGDLGAYRAIDMDPARGPTAGPTP
jgi:hypothetical protein